MTPRVLAFALLAVSPAYASDAGPEPGRVICMGSPPVCRYYEAGEAPPPVVTVDLADRMAGHAGAIGLSSAADLMTTSWALRSCPTCREANPLGADVEARVALKLGFGTAALGACWLLERGNHRGWAGAVRWAATSIFIGAAISNSVHAIRRR